MYRHLLSDEQAGDLRLLVRNLPVLLRSLKQAELVKWEPKNEPPREHVSAVVEPTPVVRTHSSIPKSGGRLSRGTSSSSSSNGSRSLESDFPKKGKTAFPTMLVSRKAITDLGYPFAEEVYMSIQPFVSLLMMQLG